MIYELLIYTAHVGRMPDLLHRFDSLVLPMWRKHGIRQAGFWTALDGADSHDLTYLGPGNPWRSARPNGPRLCKTRNGQA
ncbi:MAG: NIPSNAP family protein, partial [Rhodoferax sp.]|uniref:NIPSNAP family protein n=1 Tax=Rhodoferax sp. TaxID=50421 RepID=UPI0032668FD5